MAIELNIDFNKPDLGLMDISLGMSDVLKQMITAQQELAGFYAKMVNVNKIYKYYHRKATLLIHTEESTNSGALKGKKLPITQAVRDIYVEERIDAMIFEDKEIEDFIMQRWELEQKINTSQSVLDSLKQVHRVLQDMSMAEISIHKYSGSSPDMDQPPPDTAEEPFDGE
jgi:hypothetical protein